MHAACAPGQEQIGGISAGDQKHKDDRAHQQQYERTGRPVQRFHKWLYIGIPALFETRMQWFERPQDAVQFRFCQRG
jgi:hypothetical protein